MYHHAPLTGVANPVKFSFVNQHPVLNGSKQTRQEYFILPFLYKSNTLTAIAVLRAERRLLKNDVLYGISKR